MVTVTGAVPVLAALGVPPMAPLPGSMARPAGSPEAPYEAMSVSAVADGVMSVTATPTCSDPGTVQLGDDGATRSTRSVRVTGVASVNPVFDASTVTETPTPVR